MFQSTRTSLEISLTSSNLLLEKTIKRKYEMVFKTIIAQQENKLWIWENYGVRIPIGFQPVFLFRHPISFHWILDLADWKQWTPFDRYPLRVVLLNEFYDSFIVLIEVSFVEVKLYPTNCGHFKELSFDFRLICMSRHLRSFHIFFHNIGSFHLFFNTTLISTNEFNSFNLIYLRNM